ncbi:MAG TPA: hypothetical protein VG015_04920 [Candidatus Dormibacteraeota bacterium]|nr:hypothetical protein [Candidatus Dormibacteraeota bacterium]
MSLSVVAVVGMMDPAPVGAAPVVALKVGQTVVLGAGEVERSAVVAVGAVVEVSLGGVANADHAVSGNDTILHLLGERRVAAAPGSPPGADTYLADFAALTAGRTSIDLTRSGADDPTCVPPFLPAGSSPQPCYSFWVTVVQGTVPPGTILNDTNEGSVMRLSAGTSFTLSLTDLSNFSIQSQWTAPVSLDPKVASVTSTTTIPNPCMGPPGSFDYSCQKDTHFIANSPGVATIMTEDLTTCEVAPVGNPYYCRSGPLVTYTVIVTATGKHHHRHHHHRS